MFKLQFFAGDRAPDISNILVQEVKEIPDKSGYVFSHTYSKTLRGGDGKSNIFIIKRFSHLPHICFGTVLPGVLKFRT